MKIWTWITGGLLALAGILAGMLKIRNTQYKDTKDKLEVREKAVEIRKGQEEAKTEILIEEKQRVKKADRTGYTADDLNKL